MLARALAVVVSFTSVVPFAPSARADAPPPDGHKYVQYGFRVDGLGKAPDHVVVAFPWSLSNGAPTREHAVLADATLLRVGRRSPDVVLYAVKKPAWEAFAKTLPSEERAQVDALKAFFAGPEVVRCSAAPSPSHVLPTSDPRSLIEDVLTVTTIDDKSCVLAATPAPRKTSASGCGSALVDHGRVGVALSLLLLVGLALSGRRRARINAASRASP